jgi:predicted DNA binding protein
LPFAEGRLQRANGRKGGNARQRKDGGSLTARQEEVLLHCCRRGYYAIPRRVTLKDLALDLKVSAPSLSLLLRRAEAKLVFRFAAEEGGTG